MSTESGKTRTDSIIESIKEKARGAREISKLASLFKWLLADQEYQLGNVPGEGASPMKIS